MTRRLTIILFLLAVSVASAVWIVRHIDTAPEPEAETGSEMLTLTDQPAAPPETPSRCNLCF